jgi:hypothetical protein
MAEQKTYIKGVKLVEKHFDSGSSILKMGIKVDTLIEQLNAMKNDKGYVNLGISIRKEPGQYGDTHSLWLDTWQPKQARADVPRSSNPASRYAPENTEQTAQQVNDVDLPF